jgi:hypothetical protein
MRPLSHVCHKYGTSNLAEKGVMSGKSPTQAKVRLEWATSDAPAITVTMRDVRCSMVIRLLPHG